MKSKTTSIFCIPLQAKNLSALYQKIEKAQKKADILEIWLDQLPFVDCTKIRKKTKKPLLFVNKSPKEKGSWPGTESQRIDLLITALQAGANYIDIGIHTKPSLLKKLLTIKKQTAPTAKIIISYHHFNRTPSLKDLWKIVKKAKKLGADIIKIATTAKNIEDNLIIFNLLTKALKAKIPIIALAMGERGRISRVLGPAFGSYLTYVALDQKSKTAPGQLTVEEIFVNSFNLF